MGGQLCSAMEICPRGPLYYGPLGKAEGGMRSSNMWVPTRDSYNTWVDIGNVGESDGISFKRSTINIKSSDLIPEDERSTSVAFTSNLLSLP